MQDILLTLTFTTVEGALSVAAKGHGNTPDRD
jgi:hypothetical protein